MKKPEHNEFYGRIKKKKKIKLCG